MDIEENGKYKIKEVFNENGENIEVILKRIFSQYCIEKIEEIC